MCRIPIRELREEGTISPKLFAFMLEDVLKTLDWDEKGIRINAQQLFHLRFADDIVILSKNSLKLKRCLLI